MTFREGFYAEQAFLKKASSVIESKPSGSGDEDLTERTIAVLACAFALEAIINRIYIKTDIIRHYDQLNLQAKIQTLGDYSGVDVTYGKEPWATISDLIKTRNWLVHYKEPVGGLLGTMDDKYLRDDFNKPPKRGSFSHLSDEALEKYFKAVLEGLGELVEAFGLWPEFEYLRTGDYRVRLLG